MVNFLSSSEKKITYTHLYSQLFNSLDYSTGVGYATMTIVFFLDIYYCIIIAWTLFYLLATLISIPELPWGTCGKEKMLWYNDGVQVYIRNRSDIFTVTLRYLEL